MLYPISPLMSQPEWRHTGDSGVQVMKPSPFNNHVLLGSRQFIKAVEFDDTPMHTLRSMKSLSATTALAFHPNAESVLAAAGANGEVSVWYYGASNVAALNEKWTAHSRAIHAMEFLPGAGSFLVTASADGDLNIWELPLYEGKRDSWKKPKFLTNPRNESSGLRDLDCRENNGGLEILVASEQGTVELYSSLTMDPRDVRFSFKIVVSTQTINSIRFHPQQNSTIFATGGKDSYIRIFDLKNKGTRSVSFDELTRESVYQIHSIRSLSSVWAVRWRPVGFFIAACQSVMDSSIYVWDLDSRLMPAYVFSSHTDSVTDFFWADPYHLVSCSRDGSIQMHALGHAEIPLEKMRTVNISIAPSPGGVETLTSLCSSVDRARFEKSHGPLDLHGKTGFATWTGKTIARPSPGVAFERPIKNVPVSNRTQIIAYMAKPIVQFVADIARASTRMDVATLCLDFAKVLPEDGEVMSMIGWLMSQESGSWNSIIIPEILQHALERYRATNNLVLALALGSICLYATHPEYLALVDTKAYVAWSASLLNILHRMKLWQLSAEFIFHTPLAEIRALSHSRTGVTLGCQRCQKECEVGQYECSKCKAALAVCVLCGERVRGIFVACPACHQGGHLNHMRVWLSTHNNACPSCSQSHIVH